MFLYSHKSVIEPSLTFYCNAFPPDPKAVRVGVFFPNPGGRNQRERTEGFA